ncbi:hypothetical protein M378DRAFT_422850 [Amanita muscaria Koide BX008]|uniref:Uncharacterized protein n=1 Tax=Amanita muscaria (strain Koide BX008) TaxID=946122 RepID=A0A0C2S329_AMAMK|nr:hypothetical protein M378DRAFT_422850 [Amanita muscaria Koide BX008]
MEGSSLLPILPCGRDVLDACASIEMFLSCWSMNCGSEVVGRACDGTEMPRWPSSPAEWLAGIEMLTFCSSLASWSMNCGSEVVGRACDATEMPRWPSSPAEWLAGIEMLTFCSPLASWSMNCGCEVLVCPCFEMRLSWDLFPVSRSLRKRIMLTAIVVTAATMPP